MSILPLLHKLSAPLLSQLARLSFSTRLAAIALVSCLIGILIGSRWLPTCALPEAETVVAPVLHEYARHQADTAALQAEITALQQQAAQQPATDCLGDRTDLINQARELTTGATP